MRKVIEVFILALLFLLLAKSHSWAYYTSPDDQVQKWEDSVYGSDAFNLPSHGSETADSLIVKATELIAGPANPDYQAKYGGGAISAMSGLLASLYLNPPASGIEYFADLGKNLGLVPKTAYAQGTGFVGLRSLLPLWKTFRDIAYSFFILLFIGIGLAIMFRVKIDPKTVITIQNALPRIVIALILVTFSYAIAGLLIDLMYVVSAIGVSVIAPPINLAQAIENIGLGGGGQDAPNALMFGVLFFSTGLKYALNISKLFNPVTLAAELLHVPDQLIDILQGATSFSTGIFSSLVFLILLIVLLITYFRLFFALLRAYISIILSIIVGPIQIMLHAFPGRNSFTGWMRGLIANLSVFPTVIIMLALTAKLTELAETGQIWMPPLIKPPLVGAPGNIIVAIMGYGMFLMTPKIVDIIKEALSIKPFKYGTAIGEAFGPIKMGARMGVGPAAGRILPGRAPTPQWYWKVYDFGKGLKWWS